MEKLKSRKHEVKERTTRGVKRGGKSTAAGKLGAALAVAAASMLTAQAEFIIEGSAGAFVPSFRDLVGIDGGNTTYFGWTGNNDGVFPSPDDFGFDGPTNDSIVDNPPVIISPEGLNGTLNQIGTTPILASSNNIFAANFATNESVEAHLTLEIPTNGVPGEDGYTTIILQGIGSLTDEGIQMPVTPGPINGIYPTFEYAMRTSSQQQWWAKYEIPGNAAVYTVDLHLMAGEGINPTSLRELHVDTLFSTTGYAPDTAIPEPASVALLGLSGVMLATRRRRTLLPSA